MRIAVVGCGYVVDDYLRTLPQHPELDLAGVTDLDAERAGAIARRYGTRHYATTEELLEDGSVDLVLNLTNPQSHVSVSSAALRAGKHVYSEKPLALRLSDAENLAQLARQRGLVLSGAPCNLLGESWATVRRLIDERAVGDVRLVYAELDDNPIHLMHPEEWRSESGAPWPFENEFQIGCTLEHAAYHVAALASLFGPVQSVTAYAACLVPEKLPARSARPSAPDFSVAALRFRSGVVARLTCSVVAPYDHRVRLVGQSGVITVDEVWHNRSPVYVEPFTQLSLNARKIRAVRHSKLLRSVSGIDGHRESVAPERSTAHDATSPVGRSWHSALRAGLRRRQMTSMDFLLGVEDVALALRQGREPVISAEFLLHVTDVTLTVAGGGTPEGGVVPTHTFTPVTAPRISGGPYRQRVGPLARVSERVLPALHRRS